MPTRRILCATNELGAVSYPVPEFLIEAFWRVEKGGPQAIISIMSGIRPFGIGTFGIGTFACCKKLKFSAAILSLLTAWSAAACTSTSDSTREPPVLPRDYPIRPVPFPQVKFRDGFWLPRLETHRRVTLPAAFRRIEESGHVSRFTPDPHDDLQVYKWRYSRDSDVYKVMEGAAYTLQTAEDASLRDRVEGLIRIVSGSQWDDGYLYTFYSVPERRPDLRWTDVGRMHELYCMGHMFEAAAAHVQATGSWSFLDIAQRAADLVCETFGPEKRTDPPGHQEIEIGLARLYRSTGEKRYLDQARFFLKQRGRQGNRGPDGQGGLYGSYSQDHLPVTEQAAAVGHAVRAAYMYTAMADVAALTGDSSMMKAVLRIWDDIVGSKLYITGGIGLRAGNEGFGEPFELPNDTAYCETCASIANAMWNHRMFLMTGEGKFMDVVERALYNGILSGVSLRGDTFFYGNPLQSDGQHERSPWFRVACCPSNIARFLPSLPGYQYASTADEIYIGLYIGGRAEVPFRGRDVGIVMETGYPWEGSVKIILLPERRQRFTVKLRIPGWAEGRPLPGDLYRYLGSESEPVRLSVNGMPVDAERDRGFAVLTRIWTSGDTIELTLPLPPRRVVARPEVAADRGRTAVVRGPIVFCAEGIDNNGRAFDLVLPDTSGLKAVFRPDLLGGIVVLEAEAGDNAASPGSDKGGSAIPEAPAGLTLIPYHVWAHRGKGRMAVWLLRRFPVS